MMGSSLKGEETLQVNLVGTNGIKNVLAITDGSLKVRGMVGSPRFSLPISSKKSGNTKITDLLGEGQIQITRNHPTWKMPQNGIVSLRETTIPLNLALYMAESEQRHCYIYYNNYYSCITIITITTNNNNNILLDHLQC